MSKFKVGDRIYYTGDRANGESWGTVVKVEPCKWYGLKIHIEYDDERFEGDTKRTIVQPFNFSPGPGCRFYTEAGYHERRERYLKTGRWS